MGDAGLLHDGVCSVSGKASLIDRECAVSDRALPDLMVPAAMTDKPAFVSLQKVDDFAIEAFRHSVGYLPVTGQLGLDANVQ